jgi:hypothetical protein
MNDNNEFKEILATLVSPRGRLIDYQSFTAKLDQQAMIEAQNDDLIPGFGRKITKEDWAKIFKEGKNNE